MSSVTRQGFCPDCGGPLVFDSGLYHCDGRDGAGGCGAWDRESIWDWGQVPVEDTRDEVLFPAWMERGLVSGEIPDIPC